ncbi:MAG: endonuclease III domain-containing protein [Clostridia bacterium]|nr:endonuclease III domain-containing protein [Clostridia bacterium]
MEKEIAFLMDVYRRLYDYFGPRGWWPGETPLEVVIGAILTQSVAWRNVEKAIDNLKDANLLSVEALAVVDQEALEPLIVPTRYYKAKAKKLKVFINHLVGDHNGHLDSLFQGEMEEVRRKVLSLWGIGPETADSILLYAGNHPTFVVDAYTRRIFHRLGIFPEDVNYETMREYFMRHLPVDISLYNEYHALIVGLGNRVCAANKPDCRQCPLHDVCQKFRKESAHA